ncbi:MAG: hypothetical protein AAGA30_03720, partial [Planctomycetota bacterium]
MRILLSLAVVLTTMAVYSASSEAQFNDGYRFGAGAGFGRGLFFGSRLVPREQPPYFAQFPPVYYSGIVRRPYGISPYAAPPGIAPVELSVPQPVTVKNPFFDTPVEVAPASAESNEEVQSGKDANGNKVTKWRAPTEKREILIKKK